jgi:glucose/mannose-6-phosphate isomerase
MLPTIHDFPNQISDAWRLVTASDIDLPAATDIDHILVSGMGGSAIAADLVAGLVTDTCPIPVHCHRDYGLPAWVNERTLVIASSYSGNTEETLSAWQEAEGRNAGRLAITTGGRLAKQAKPRQLLQFDYDAQPRAALGYSFTLLLGVVHRMGLVENPESSLRQFTQKATTDGTIPPATLRQLALDLTRHCQQGLPVILAAEHLAAVARRWTTQINENAKAWAFWNTYPELDHNLIVGLEHPEGLRTNRVGDAGLPIVHLSSTHYHGQTIKRIRISQELMERAGHRVETVRLDSQDRLEELLWHTWLGDYLSHDLAEHYNVDPTPVEAIEHLKQRLAE